MIALMYTFDNLFRVNLTTEMKTKFKSAKEIKPIGNFKSATEFKSTTTFESIHID